MAYPNLEYLSSIVEVQQKFAQSYNYNVAFFQCDYGLGDHGGVFTKTKIALSWA